LRTSLHSSCIKRENEGRGNSPTTISTTDDSRVYLASKLATGDIYAIKVMRKEEMVERNQVEHVMAERNILASTSCPYVVSLYYAFQTRVRNNAHHSFHQPLLTCDASSDRVPINQPG